MAGFSRCWRRRDQTTHSRLGLANSIGIGFQRGTHTRWQLVANDGTGAPTLTDMGASFAIATGGVLTLFIAAPPNGSSVWVRVVDEVSCAVFEQQITAVLPGATQFLSPRRFLNTPATAAATLSTVAGHYQGQQQPSQTCRRLTGSADLVDGLSGRW